MSGYQETGKGKLGILQVIGDLTSNWGCNMPYEILIHFFFLSYQMDHKLSIFSVCPFPYSACLILLSGCSIMVYLYDFQFIVLINDLCLLFLSAASWDSPELKASSSQLKELKNVAFGILAVCAVTAASPVIAASQVKSILSFFGSIITQMKQKPNSQLLGTLDHPMLNTSISPQSSFIITLMWISCHYSVCSSIFPDSHLKVPSFTAIKLFIEPHFLFFFSHPCSF